jgi:hypothetical protein
MTDDSEDMEYLDVDEGISYFTPSAKKKPKKDPFDFMTIKFNKDTYDVDHLIRKATRSASPRFSSENAKSVSRITVEKSNEVFERLMFNKQISENKRKFMQQEKEYNELKDCTFSPSIRGTPERRTFTKFLSDQVRHQLKKEKRLLDLRMIHKTRDSDGEEGKLELSEGTRKIMSARKERNIHERLFMEHIRVDRLDRTLSPPDTDFSFKPSISPASKHLKTTSKIEQRLYEDAIRRRNMGSQSPPEPLSPKSMVAKSREILVQGVIRDVNEYWEQLGLGKSITFESYHSICKMMFKLKDKDLEMIISSWNWLFDKKNVVGKEEVIMMMRSILGLGGEFKQFDKEVKANFGELAEKRNKRKENKDPQILSFSPKLSPKSIFMTKNRSKSKYTDLIKIYNEKTENNRKKRLEHQEGEKLKYCTFSPKLNKTYNKKVQSKLHSYNSTPSPNSKTRANLTFDRLNSTQHTSSNSGAILDDLLSERNLELIRECTFSPKINLKILKSSSSTSVPRGWDATISRIRSAGKLREELNKKLERGEPAPKKPPRPTRMVNHKHNAN